MKDTLCTHYSSECTHITCGIHDVFCMFSEGPRKKKREDDNISSERVQLDSYEDIHISTWEGAAFEGSLTQHIHRLTAPSLQIDASKDLNRVIMKRRAQPNEKNKDKI